MDRKPACLLRADDFLGVSAPSVPHLMWRKTGDAIRVSAAPRRRERNPYCVPRFLAGFD